MGAGHAAQALCRLAECSVPLRDPLRTVIPVSPVQVAPSTLLAGGTVVLFEGFDVNAYARALTTSAEVGVDAHRRAVPTGASDGDVAGFQTGTEVNLNYASGGEI